MKKIIFMLITTITILAAAAAYAAEPTDIKVQIDGADIPFAEGEGPMMENERTLVPLRIISENLGASVEWEDATKKITLKKGNDVVSMNIGQPYINMNGTVSMIDVSPVLINNITYVPLRLSANALRAEIKWSDETRTANISTTTINARIVGQIPEMSFFMGNQYDYVFNYRPQLNAGRIEIVEQPPLNQYMMGVYKLDSETLDTVYKIVKVYFPQSHDRVIEMFNETVKNGSS